MFSGHEVLMKIYFEEYLWTDFRKWLFGTAFKARDAKPSWLSNMIKIPVAFKLEPQKQFGTHAVFIFNPYAFFWT